MRRAKRKAPGDLVMTVRSGCQKKGAHRLAAPFVFLGQVTLGFGVGEIGQIVHPVLPRLTTCHQTGAAIGQRDGDCPGA